MSQVTATKIENVYANDQADAGFEEEIYRSLSRSAVLSLAFGLLGLLSWYSPLLLFLPALSFIFAVIAFRNFAKYPSELSGKNLAKIGFAVSLLVLAIAPARHIYIYYTEVPEGFERISFYSLTNPSSAPQFPTEIAMSLNGKKVFVKGYIHPTSLSSNASKSFVLVPDITTCCFGGQPPLTHMIEVRLVNEHFASKDLRLHSLAGTLSVHPYLKSIEGLQGAYYEIEAEHFQ